MIAPDAKSLPEIGRKIRQHSSINVVLRLDEASGAGGAFHNNVIQAFENQLLIFRALQQLPEGVPSLIPISKRRLFRREISHDWYQARIYN
jgi:hypothetical protein